jgi:CheY-like chemotaxis protein
MGKKILLADDSITIQKVIELTFSDEDFDVVTVGNGRLAIEKLHETRPDVVLCDIIMPEKDGYEVCEYIKKDPALAHIPVLLLTGAFEPFDQERATRVGCDGYLAKPFEPQTLITRVKALLAQSSVPQKPAAGPAPVPVPTHVEFEPIDEVKAPAAIAQDFEPLAAAGDFEPLDAVAFEPLPPSPEPEPEPETLVEPEPFVEYMPEVPPASPTETIVPRAAQATPVAPIALMESVAFIPEEPDADLPPPAVPAAPQVASTPAFEPMFVPEDEPPAASEPELEEYEAAVTPEPLVVGETLPPMQASWAGTTVEVPLEERAQASVEAAYGNDFGSGPETVLDDVSLEPDADPLEGDPEPVPDLDVATLGDQSSIFEAMGLDQEAGAKVQAELAETEPGTPEPLSESVEWEEDDALEGVVAGASSAEAAGAEILLDDDLSAPADVAAAVEAAAAAVEAEAEPELEPELDSELEPLGNTPPPPAPPVLAVPLSALAAFSAPPPPPVSAPPAAPPVEEESFEEVLPPQSEPVPAGQPSRAAEVAVPVDMVAQIAQRVVGQISEKVIREIAWEIIPELAEALIKKEIERLKAELDQLPR